MMQEERHLQKPVEPKKPNATAIDRGRGETPRKAVKQAAVCLALLCSSAPAPGQVFVETLDFHTPGERQLLLQGIFQDADTVLLQVYHHGEELLMEPRVNTFQVTLGAHEAYVLKFTDQRHRVKQLYIQELSDDMIEFYPPLVIAFNRPGNLQLRKSSDGRPGWWEEDVGSSRKHRRDAPGGDP